MSGFLYPRTATLRRPKSTKTTQVGDVGFSAERGAADETVVCSNLPCSIQFDRQGQRNTLGLPTDARYQPLWKVLFPRSAMSDGTAKSADVFADDLGRRFQVFAAVPTSLGVECRCILLEA